MNMSPIAALFLLQCIFLMDSSEADPLIDVTPSEITVGTTSTLDINCTFSPNNHPEMAALVSLVLSRANVTGQNFEELAAITEFSPNSVTLLTQEKVAAIGLHSQTGETFLHLTWQYPTALQGGVYRCSAIGVGMIGHNVEMTNISSVTINEANLNDIFEKLQQLEMHESSMQQQILTLKNDTLSMEQKIQTLENDKQSMEQNILTLQNDKISMEKQIADLQSNNSYLEDVVVSFIRARYVNLGLDFLGRHDFKDYYISSNAFTNVNQAIGVCKSLGGQLAVVDDEDEYSAIKSFLDGTSGIELVVVAGTDEQKEGTWVLPESDTPMPFTSWSLGHPYSNNRRNNCVMLYPPGSWSMIDNACTINTPQGSIRFMCETSTF